MKKILLLLSVSLFTLSCSDADPEIYDGDTIAYFTSGTSSRFPVEQANTSGSEKFITVGVSSSSSSERSFQIEILPDDDLTDDIVYADPSQFSIDQSTLVIPANSFTGEIRVVSFYDDLPTVGSVFVKLKLSTIEGGKVLGNDNVYTIELFRSCPVSDFVGNFSSNTWWNGPATNQIIESATANSIEIVNFLSDSATEPNLVLNYDSNFNVTFTARNTGFYSNTNGGFIWARLSSDPSKISSFNACTRELTVHINYYIPNVGSYGDKVEVFSGL